MHGRPTAMILALTLTVACAGASEPAGRRVTPSYAAFSGRLVALYADQNGDGRVDQWTYVDGNRVLRGEADADGDGRIDRWEYFDGAGRLAMVGTASTGGGVEDTWTFAEAGGERRVDRARARDRHVDRREYFRGDTLLRAEEDTNSDGRIDRWDRFEGGLLLQAEFDTTLNNDRPNRRIVYDGKGHFLRVEADDERDGTFVELVGAREADIKGVKK